jgi:hypothetical protein
MRLPFLLKEEIVKRIKNNPNNKPDDMMWSHFVFDKRITTEEKIDYTLNPFLQKPKQLTQHALDASKIAM